MEVMQVATDYSTLSKDELAAKLGEAFEEADPYVQRGEPIPSTVWTQINQTVTGLCERFGVDAPMGSRQ